MPQIDVFDRTGATVGSVELSDELFAAPVNAALTLQITTDPTFATGITALNGTTDSTKDYTCKLDISGLSPTATY